MRAGDNTTCPGLDIPRDEPRDKRGYCHLGEGQGGQSASCLGCSVAVNCMSGMDESSSVSDQFAPSPVCPRGKVQDMRTCA